MLFHGPIARSLMRARATRELMAAGYSRADARHAFDLVGDDVYPAAFSAAGVNPAVELSVGAGEAHPAAGDTSPPVGGPVIDAIVAWLKSDQGQAVIAALVRLLIAALVAV